jgi:hypothetical protein
MRSPPTIALSLIVVMISAGGTLACSGEPGEDPGFELEEELENQNNQNQKNDEEEPTLQLQGQLAPAGGLAISDEFTLSGELQPVFEARVSSSEEFRLELASPTQSTPHSADD